MAAGGRDRSCGGLIIRQKEPSNLEAPFDQVESYLTPTGLFYVRSHFPAPSVDLGSYQPRIDGAVRDALALTYRELHEMPSERWQMDWMTPAQLGRYVLLARATDAEGHIQPDRHDPSCGSHAIDHPLPVEIFVDDPSLELTGGSLPRQG
jgi:hypothetical protein